MWGSEKRKIKQQKCTRGMRQIKIEKAVFAHDELLSHGVIASVRALAINL